MDHRLTTQQSAVGIGLFPEQVWDQAAIPDKLLTLGAMKMQTTIYAPCDGVVEQIFVQVGGTVESKELLMRLREA